MGTLFIGCDGKAMASNCPVNTGGLITVFAGATSAISVNRARAALDRLHLSILLLGVPCIAFGAASKNSRLLVTAYLPSSMETTNGEEVSRDKKPRGARQHKGEN